MEGGVTNSHYFNENMFENISAQNGGAFYVMNQNITISSSKFNLVTAENEGGVVFLVSINLFNINWIIENNIFTNNHAKSGGAVHSIGDIPSKIYQNTFLGNRAEYGEVIFSLSNFMYKKEFKKKYMSN